MSSKSKSKLLKTTVGNKDIVELFQEVLGTGEGGKAAMSVTLPKYGNIETHVGRFIKTLSLLQTSAAMERHPGMQQHLAAYVAALQKQAAERFCFDRSRMQPYLRPVTDGVTTLMVPDFDAVPPELSTEFAGVYAAVKSCSLVNTVVVTCSNLTKHKPALQDQAKLNDRFLTQDAGILFTPLPELPQMNFKQVYNEASITPADKKFVLLILHKLYTTSHDAYEAVSAPDVNVAEFTELVTSSIDQVKRVPELHRCGDAFAKIASSVDLLKTNFDGYFKDFSESGNPSIIMEHFIIDVSKDAKASPKVTMQFRKIIAYYRNMANNRERDPKLDAVFSRVNESFKELEKGSEEAPEKESDSDSDEPPPALMPAAPAPTPAPESVSAPVAGPSTEPGKKTRNRKKKSKAAAQDSPGLAEEFDAE